MLLNVTIELAVNQVLQIPEKAIVPLQNRHYVFVVDGKNQVSQREVTLGLRTPGQVEVRSGLAVGDEIVIEGTQKLRAGLTITKVE
jgi:membrane fusion protein (multidrug efflux system)